ncbi:hypothetical protein IFO70_18210 [Phormidium tenue FACHB-886]|nr:hypothetical protein [Phormidium tenue FACHB-886]
MKFARSSLFFCTVFVIITLSFSGSFFNRYSSATAQTQPELVQELETEPLRREWGFLIEQYPIQHQGKNKLNFTLRCVPKVSDPGGSTPVENIARAESPDSSTIYRQITNFLSSYPNEDDYWERVNRNLTEAILREYPMLASVTANLEVLPTQQTPYTRSTTVTHTDDGKILESWSFITGQVTVEHQGEHKLNLRVKYRYQDGISSADYPNFIPIYARIEQFLSTYANSTDSWETVNRNLVSTVLREYPVMDSFTSKLEVKPTPRSPYHYFTTITRAQSDA